MIVTPVGLLILSDAARDALMGGHVLDFDPGGPVLGYQKEPEMTQ